MRILGTRGFAAIAVAGLIGSMAMAADDEDDAPRSKPASTRTFGRTGKFGKPKPPPVTAIDPVKEIEKPAPISSVTATREREYNAYLRRLQACDRLQEIALANNDEAMLGQIEELQARVWAVFQQNTNHGSSGSTETDEAALTRGLPTDKTGQPLLKPKDGATKDGTRMSLKKERP